MSVANPKAVTATIPFCSANLQGTHLFSVNAGVSVDDALAMSSCFLDDALHSMEADSEPNFAAIRLVMMAKAVVDSVITQNLVDWAQGLGKTEVAQ